MSEKLAVTFDPNGGHTSYLCLGQAGLGKGDEMCVLGQAGLEKGDEIRKTRAGKDVRFTVKAVVERAGFLVTDSDALTRIAAYQDDIGVFGSNTGPELQPEHDEWWRCYTGKRCSNLSPRDLGGEYLCSRIKCAAAAVFVFRGEVLVVHGSMGLTVVPVEFNRRAGDPPVETWAFPDTQIKGEDKSTGELYRVDPHDASADRPPAGVELSQKYQQVGTGSTLHARAGDGVADLYAIGKLISEWGKEPVRVCHEQMIAHCRKRYDAERTSQDGQPRTEASDELMFWPFAGYNAPPPRLFELILGISPFLQSYYTREMGAHFIGTFIETNGIGSEQWAGIVDHEPRLVDGDTSHIEARLCFHEDREKRWSTRVSSRGEDAFVFVVDKADTLEYVNVPRSLYPRMISKRLMLTLPRMTLEMAMRSGSRQEEWLMDTPSYKATVAAAPMAAAAGMIRVDSEYAPRVLDVFRIWNTEGSPNKPPDGGGRWYQIGNPRDLCWHTPIELTLENAERGSRILKASLGADHGEITFDLRYDRVRMRLVEARDPSNLEGPTPVEDWFDHERIKMYADQTYYDNQVGCHGIRRGSAADYALDTKVYERDEYVDLEERYQAPQWFALEFKAGTGQEHVNAYGLRRTPGCRWVHTIEASIRRGMFRAEEVAARFDAEMGYMRTHLKKGTDPNTIRDAWGTARMQHVSEPTEEKIPPVSTDGASDDFGNG